LLRLALLRLPLLRLARLLTGLVLLLTGLVLGWVGRLLTRWLAPSGIAGRRASPRGSTLGRTSRRWRLTARLIVTVVIHNYMASQIATLRVCGVRWSYSPGCITATRLVRRVSAGR
jgi:hypothetical protein